jgi:hypothetical protein
MPGFQKVSLISPGIEANKYSKKERFVGNEILVFGKILHTSRQD